MSQIRPNWLSASDNKPVVRSRAESGKVTGSAHFGASMAREFSSWDVSTGSADSDLNPELATLIARSRDLTRNNGIAAGVIQAQKDNVVGTGPRLALMPDYRALGKDKQWAREFARQVEAGFRSWFESRECDACGHLDGGLLTRQVLFGCLANGSALALPLYLAPSGRRKWALQIQLVEADRLSNPLEKQDTERLRNGVELDRYGRPVAYHIRTTHPGEQFYLWSTGRYRWEKVPAETSWGRKRVLHVYDPERTGQNRGKPYLTPVIGKFRMLDNYQRTELQAAVINAVIAAAIETPLDGNAAGELFGVADGPDSGKVKQHRELIGEVARPMKGAMVMSMPIGTKLNLQAPARPAEQFGAFCESVIRDVCAGLNLPYELVMKDFSRTNYSSARAALLEAWRGFQAARQWLKVTFLDELLKLWMEEAISSGVVDMVTLDEFYGQMFAVTKCQWIWPGRGWVDPAKEAQAAEIRINTGLSNLQRECAEQGLDYEEVLEQLAVEQKMKQELGLQLGDRRALANATEEKP